MLILAIGSCVRLLWFSFLRINENLFEEIHIINGLYVSELVWKDGSDPIGKRIANNSFFPMTE
jgi:hypothetical protein